MFVIFFIVLLFGFVFNVFFGVVFSEMLCCGLIGGFCLVLLV